MNRTKLPENSVMAGAREAIGALLVSKAAAARPSFQPTAECMARVDASLRDLKALREAALIRYGVSSYDRAGATYGHSNRLRTLQQVEARMRIGK